MSDDILKLPPPPPGQIVPYGTDPDQFAELRLPEGPGPYPVVIVIHGGFWRVAYGLDHIGHLCVALNKRGAVTWSLEYRRLGSSGGGWPGTFQDVAAATDKLRDVAARYALDLSRTVSLGHSAGGQLALWLAARHALPASSVLFTESPLRVRGVVSLAGVVDLRKAFEFGLSRNVVAELMGGEPEAAAERYAQVSPMELIPFGSVQLLIHGTADGHVPFEISREYVAAAAMRGENARLITLEGAGHFEMIDPRSRLFAVVEEAVREAIGGSDIRHSV